MSETSTPRPKVAPKTEETNAGKKLPAKVRLVHSHGFIEPETRRHRLWQAGEMVVSPAEIELLISRGARIEEVE